MSKGSSLSHEDLASFAHELRGALTVIAGYTEILRNPLSESERESALDGIDRAISRADMLCTEALAEQTTGGVEHEFAPLSLSVLAEQVAADQRTTTGRTIETLVEGTAPVVGDANALARVLSNLIDNAAKYSLCGAPIEVRVAEEEGVSTALSVIEVTDRGPGIPPSALERVREPFARLARDADRPGKGLGLSIAGSVLEAHGGRLIIGARDGGGTIVRLELPRA